MGMAMTILTVVEVILALLLIGIILIQPTKSGGGLSAMGNNMTENVFGAGTNTVLLKGTIILGSLFFVVTIALVIISSHRQSSMSLVEKQAVRNAAAAATKPAADVKPTTPTAPAAGTSVTVPVPTAEAPAAAVEKAATEVKKEADKAVATPAPAATPAPVTEPAAK